MKRYKWLILLGCILAAYTTGRYSAPAKVVVQTKIKVQKVVETKIKTKIIVREKPSGEKITTIVYQNDTVSKEKTSHQKTKVIHNEKPQWIISVGKSPFDYQLSVDRRIIGNLFIGGSVSVNDPQLQIQLRYLF